MGLNLDVDHVAFASDRKYDGYQFRRLNPSEFAQIAGRAGRATRDGTFGTTGRCAPFEPELVNALQNHTFESVKVLQWRNSKLDFSSLGALQVSLALTPSHEALTRAPIAEDLRVLDHAARDADVREMAHGAAAVERLWDACQIPDYRKIAPAAHAELVTTLFGFLMHKGRIPDAWFAAQVEQADRVDGDIDTLSGRIAQIRTWTFVANRPDWLADPEHWQGIAREVENKLSDALHERLTERFVDRRTSVLMRRLRENTMLNTEIGKTGEVIVEGHVIGRLDGFTFAPDAAEAGSDAKALQATAQKALAGEIDARAEKLAAAPDEQFVLASDGTIRWTGDAVAKLVAADDALHPRMRIISDERLSGAPREAVQTRLDLWLKTHIEKLLGPLFDLAKAEDITGIARGIAFQLIEALGVLERAKIATEMKDLDQPSRATLAQIRRAVRRLSHLCAAAAEAGGARAGLAAVGAEAGQCRHVGAVGRAASGGKRPHLVSGRQAARPRCLSRAGLPAMRRARGAGRYPGASRRSHSPGAVVARRPRPAQKPAGAFDGRGFVVTQAMTSLTGSAGEDFASILRALGYRMERRPALPPKPAPVVEAPAAESSPAEVGHGNRTGNSFRNRGRGCACRKRWRRSPWLPLKPAMSPTSPAMCRPIPRKPHPRHRRHCCPISPSRRRLLKRSRLRSKPALAKPVLSKSARRSRFCRSLARCRGFDRSAGGGCAAGAGCRRNNGGDGCRWRCAGCECCCHSSARCRCSARNGRGLAARWPLRRAPAAPRSQPSSSIRIARPRAGAAAGGRAGEAGDGAKRERHRRGRRDRNNDFRKPARRCAGRRRDTCR